MSKPLVNLPIDDDDGEPLPAEPKRSNKPKNSKRIPAAAAGRFATLNQFLDFTLRDLTAAETAVWLLVFRDTKPNGLARVGQDDLSKRSGVSTRAVRSAIVALQERGLLVVVKRGRLQSGPSTYRVLPLAKPTRP
jgi:hypothetical protein